MSLSVEEPREGKPWLSLLACLTAAYVFNFLILRAENTGMEFWFQTLRKPTWTLPTVAFAPIWTILSGFLGLAAWQVFTADPSDAGGRKVRALILIASYQCLVTTWAGIYFYWQQRTPALFICGLALLVAVAATWAAFKTKGSAGWLVTLSAIWVAYLVALSFAAQPPA
ncbi:MAG: TspO/MBR family protein [Fimbriimonas sp.]